MKQQTVSSLFLSMIETIIFDMDGVIIDSEPLWEKAEIELINQHGKTYSNLYRKNIIGLNQKDSVSLLKKTFNLHASLEDIVEQRKEILIDLYKKELEVFPGINRLLEEVRSYGYKTGLASGSPGSVINFVLEKFGLQNYFSAVVSGDSATEGKPSPEIYLKTAEILSSRPKNCIAIEDSVNGVISVKNAGMFCIAVPHPDLDIKLYGSADIIYKNISEINISRAVAELSSGK